MLGWVLYGRAVYCIGRAGVLSGETVYCAVGRRTVW